VRVHLVDGTYELFRGHFGAPPAKGPDGAEVGATRGLGRQLLSLVRRDRATHVAVAFDSVIESFRNDLFGGYKSGEGIDPDLLMQFAWAEELARALGFVTWSMVEFEADDALATAARRFAALEEVDQVRIASPDKDLAQCVQGQRVVGLDVRRDKLIDEAAVEEKFGISPLAIPDYLALVGDSADGIPGIPRWGAKSSSLLLAEYGTVEAIPRDPGVWNVKVRGAGALARELGENEDELALYKRLATLRLDVPLKEDLAALEWKGPDVARLEAICAQLGDERLMAQARKLSPG
jgi:5'-3' exonuclease